MALTACVLSCDLASELQRQEALHCAQPSGAYGLFASAATAASPLRA